MSKKKIVLAYSGGLDTSVILKWLIVERNYDVITYTADLGQGEDMTHIKEKALKTGAVDAYVLDLREEFVKDYVFPMFRANTIYEGEYLLGTSIARPLTAKKQIEIAKQCGANAVCHGATGKRNDQIRFELSYYALMPNVEIVAPWREWDLNSRTSLLEFAKKNNIEIPNTKSDKPPYSMDGNLLHLSIEGDALEDVWNEVPDDTFINIPNVENINEKPDYIDLTFKNGDLVEIDGKKMKPHELLNQLNKIGSKHGIGRSDIVENRFIGMKSRGIYETSGGSILLKAHRAIESITLDSGEMHLKDELMPKYAKLIYNGMWFSGERKMLQSAIDQSQKFVSGTVKLKLYKGNVFVIGRKSEYSLYDNDLSTFEKDSSYDQKDASGFIKLNALRLRTSARIRESR